MYYWYLFFAVNVFTKKNILMEKLSIIKYYARLNQRYLDINNLLL